MDTGRAQAQVHAESGAAWRPTPEMIENSRLKQLSDRAGVGGYQELLTWAAADPARYWSTVDRDLDLAWHRPYSTVLNLDDGKPWARWWIEGGFNYVDTALDRHIARGRGHRTAVIWEGDDGATRRLTFAGLAAETNRVANALRALDVGRGDRVGIFLPMMPETVMTVLACGKLGAIYVPLFSGFGPEAVASRLRDAEAKLLVTVLKRNGNPKIWSISIGK